MALTIDYNRQFDTGICNPRRRIPNLQRAPPAPSLFHNLPPNFCFFNIYMYRTRPDSDLATFVYNFNLGAPVFIMVNGGFSGISCPYWLENVFYVLCSDGITLKW